MHGLGSVRVSIIKFYTNKTYISVTPQCYGCTKTLASHEHVHHHLIHKHHTMMNVSFHVCFI